MVKEISLTQGFVALVDDEDYYRLAKHSWCINKKRTNYAMRKIWLPSGKEYTEYMHRAVLDAPAGVPVDHVNRDGLDNRRANLRLSTVSHNGHNRRAAIHSSRFRGVTWHAGGRKWMAQAQVAGVWRYLGLFDVEEDAAHAYDRHVKAERGEFAVLNFPQEVAA